VRFGHSYSVGGERTVSIVSKELKERSTHITSAKSCAAYDYAAKWVDPCKHSGLSPALLSKLEHGKLLSHAAYSFGGCAGIQRRPGIFFASEKLLARKQERLRFLGGAGHRQAGV
jgi:hypothetical protein